LKKTKKKGPRTNLWGYIKIAKFTIRIPIPTTCLSCLAEVLEGVKSGTCHAREGGENNHPSFTCQGRGELKFCHVW